MLLEGDYTVVAVNFAVGKFLRYLWMKYDREY